MKPLIDMTLADQTLEMRVIELEDELERLSEIVTILLLQRKENENGKR